MTDFYNVYFGRDGDINYDTPVATMELSDTSIEIADQDLPAGSIWHYVRRRVRGHGCGLESESSPVCVIMIGEDGQAIPPAPNNPIDLNAEAVPGNRVRLRWRYSRDGQAAALHGFTVYQTTVGAAFPETPQAVMVGNIPLNDVFTWTSGELGGSYIFCVKSWNRDGGISTGVKSNMVTVGDSGRAPNPISFSGFEASS